MERITKHAKILNHELSVARKHVFKVKYRKKELFLIFAALCFVCIGGVVLWLSNLRLPDLNSIENRRVAQSTKIFDRTGKVLLYDLNKGVKRTLVRSDEISDNIKKATIAIEDAEFYEHKGIKPLSILRAIWVDITSLDYAQGGSTITQQLVKNSLLTGEQNISRKLKEWVLALKLEKIMTKDEILTLYLNESPYGGRLYGIEEASETYFGKHAKDVTLAEGAYLAALLQAPSRYSPYGKHKDELDNRQQLVLKKELENNFITQDEYTKASAEKITFRVQQDTGIKAPHFVNYVIEQLTNLYGDDALQNRGMRVITTLDYNLELKGEEIVKKYAFQNEEKFQLNNAALVAINPQTGDILSMVGSRDYFDKEIQGNFNVTTAYRQPGSTFKPIVYATAFNMGYQPETILFDTETEFSTKCSDDSIPLNGANPSVCYNPQNYDGKFDGPMNIRRALAQSRNIPALKMLYLVGINNALKTARDMGITSLSTANHYGLTLVLGGGEVSPLELTSAYGTFANNGTHVPYRSILRTEDRDGKIIQSFESESQQVLPKQTALKINSILNDYSQKTTNEYLHFPYRDVASKTGTTNDYHDSWIMGYTPNLVVGVWAGNNDNTATAKTVAGFIVGPMWRAYMDVALRVTPEKSFEKPAPEDLSSLKPILRGGWRGGGTSYFVDKISGNLATEFTPPELREERFTGEIHDILHWIDKNNPLGPSPSYPQQDPQYSHWEYGVQKWLAQNPQYTTQPIIPTEIDSVHNPSFKPQITIQNPSNQALYYPFDRITISINHTEHFPIMKVDYYINDIYLGQSTSNQFSLSFVPKQLTGIKELNTLRAVATDSVGNKAETTSEFKVQSDTNTPTTQ